MVIRNHLLPFGPFLAINLFGLIFVRRGRPFVASDLNHEQIHTRQMRELLYLPFYLIYIIEWLVRLAQTFCSQEPAPGNRQDPSPGNRQGTAPRKQSRLLRAYHRISFEREAYACQHDPDYLRHRPPYAWRHYL